MRTAIVTGGSTGIGQAICQRLLNDGYRVLNLSRRPAPIAHAALVNYPVDLADCAATAATAATIAREHKVTDVIHNAGVIRPALLGSVDTDDLIALTNIHLAAAITLVQAVLPILKASAGRILLISSRAALGLETRTGYSATKAGMIGMARTWALELAPHGVTVNVVAPGPIGETEMFQDAVPENSEKEHQIAASIPARRLGSPADVANAVAFFLKPDSSFITGQTLFVCGGSSIGSFSL